MSVANYKSVMLCERPSAVKAVGGGSGGGGGGGGGAGASGASGGGGGPAKAAAGSGGSAPFRTRVATDRSVLYQPLNNANQEALELARQERAEKRKNNFNNKYKQQLKEYSKIVKESREKEEEEERNNKFAPKKFKKFSTKINHALKQAVEPDHPSLNQEEYKPKQSVAEAMGKDEENSKGSSKGKGKGNKKKKQLAAKPAWALTEEQHEQLEEEEVDELLDFAEGLDFERYIDDFEVQQMLEVLKSRIYDLEEEKLDEEMGEVSTENMDLNEVDRWVDEEQENDDAAAQREEMTQEELQERARRRKQLLLKLRTRKRQTLADAGLLDGDQEGTGEAQGKPKDGAHGVASRILHTSHSLRSVHSTASVKQILAKQQPQDGGDVQVLDLDG